MSTVDMSATKRALTAIKNLQDKLDGLERERREPIAVIGMACRFPGGADTPEAYWDLLCSGRDAIIDVPPARWDVNAFYDADPDAPGKMITRSGGFLPSVDQFDPHLFGIAPREAASIDPQHRLVLELAWEALENANVAASSLYNSNTGVYVGISNPEYSAHLLWSGDPTRINAYAGTGGSLGVAAGRLSYLLGLTGPSMIVDTACSSSLITTHLACQSLRARECDVALSAGVNLIFGPETFINFSKARMLAPDGHCKTFDAAADGYARGEGGGMVVLKRLSDAMRDGDRVLAVIRGSAVNQDGPSGGLTVPNGPAQTRVIQQALAAGGIRPSQVGYVEAHGTGTALGDPIEMRALGSAYGEGRDPAQPLLVGSVKTNFGHLESAAGIAGLIKAILVLQHGKVPPHLHLNHPSPHIPWSELPIKVPTTLQPWSEGERYAGVSAFSFSGTNAHIVLGTAPPDLSPLPVANPDQSAQSRWRLVPMSARDDGALSSLANDWRERMTAGDAGDWDDIARTAAEGRSAMPYRLAVAADSAATMAQRLTLPGLPRARAAAGGIGKVAFLFTGQGSQYHDMAQELYRESDVFRAALDECDALLRPRIGKSLIDLIYGGSEALNITSYTQPALFSIEYALMRLWQSWGIQPDAMLGHSVGEYAAACVAGVFSLADAIGLIAERGRLMEMLCDPGAMASLPMSEAEVRKVIGLWSGEVAVATLNGPLNVVVSSNPEAVEALTDSLTAAGIDVRQLRVSHAFHSPMMEPMLAPFAAVAQSIKFRPATLRMFSTLTGKAVGTDMSTAAYWVQHVEAPVRFADGMRAMLDDGYRIFVEIGPKPTLCALGREIAESMGPEIAAECAWLPSLRAGKSSWSTILESLGHLWVRGAEVDWAALNGPGPRHARLPNYPFQRRAYGIDLRAARVPAASVVRGAHPLLGERLESPALQAGTVVFTARLSPETAGFLAHHRIFGNVVLPAAAHMEMVLAAAAKMAPAGTNATDLFITLDDVAIAQTLVLPEGEMTDVQIVLNPVAGSADTTNAWFEFHLYSRPVDGSVAASWNKHTTGRLRIPQGRVEARHVPASIDLTDLRARCPEVLSVEDYYRRTHAVGIEHGDHFRALNGLWQGDKLVLARLRLPVEVQAGADQFLLHPVLLDAAFQMVGVPLLDRGEPYLPVGMDGLLRYRRAPHELWCVVRLQEETAYLFCADLDLVDDDGHVVASVKGLRFQRATQRAMQGTPRFRHSDWLYQVDWEESIAYAPPADWLPPPAIVADLLHADMATAAKQVHWYGDLFAGLDQLIAAYARAALVELGLDWMPGQTIQLSALMNDLNIVPAYRLLLQRLLVILDEQGQLKSTPANDGWVMLNTDLHDAAKLATAIGTQFADARNELALVMQCGASLAQALDGRIPGLQLLFPQGDMSLVTRFYTESPGLLAMNDLLRSTMASALERLPRGRGVRILEIGAGTGSSTAHLLPLLPAERCRYVFSDVSAVFTNKARERFGDYPFVEYKVLDIESDPLAQGFEAGSFDIVVAANVLHATRDLGETLTRVHQLLAPGGALLLLEGTSPQPWLDLTFGLTEGWWRFADTARRPSYPLLDTVQWDALLDETGFDAMAVISPDRAAGKALCRQAVMVANKRAPTSDGDWLIFADRGGVGDALAERIRESGAQCQVVAADDTAAPELIVQRIGECRDLRGVIHARGLDAAINAELDTAGLAAAEQNGCHSLLDLMQTLSACNLAKAPRLLIVSRGAVVGPNVDEAGHLNVAQAPIWGMGHVIAAEYPELHCTQIDLDPAVRNATIDAESVWQEVRFHSREPVVLRAGADNVPARFVPRLQRMASLENSPLAPLVVQEDGMVLITGGLGGLGLITARWLVEQKGVRWLTLAGRRPPGTDATAQIASLEALGVSVRVVQVDVTDAAQVAAMIVTATKDRPLSGVIHAAGLLDDGVLNTMPWERFEAVLAPKTTGAWNLHCACEGHALDFFILFSSAASVLGPTAQANYAAANAFLDALAAFRRAQGRAAMTINWGAWSALGMVGQATPNRQLDTRGMNRIDPQQGMAILAHLFDHPVGQVLAAAIDWDQVMAQYGTQPLFARFKSAAPASTTLAAGTQSLRLRLAGLPMGQQRLLAMDIVKREVARILGLESAQGVAEEIGFFEIGMDSLTAVELRNALQVEVGESLPTTLLFKYSTVQALVGFLVDEMGAERRVLPADVAALSITQTTGSTGVEQTSIAEIEGMTDAELSAMIDAELEDL